MKSNTKKCKWCRKEFQDKTSNSNKNYCSKKCSARFRDYSEKNTCEDCGKLITNKKITCLSCTKKRSHKIQANKKIIPKEKLKYLYNTKHLTTFKIGKILSCSNVTIQSRLKEYEIKFEPYTKICAVCGKTFPIKSVFSKIRKVCSKKCGDKDYYLRVRRERELKDYSKRTCQYCSKKFIPPLRHPNLKHCSPVCNKKEYKEKNKEYFKNYSKEHYKNNINKIKKRSKDWTINNLEKYKKQNKVYYAKNREKIIKNVHEWYDAYKIRENKRRRKLGLPQIGEGFTNEMELLLYVHNLFKNYEILTHHRKTLGEWGLQGLELDIYVPELKLAFEYMGKQHYDEKTYYLLTSYNRIKEEFEAQQYRDRCKKKLCKLKGITLIRIKYDENLSEQLVLSKLKYTTIKTNQEVLKWT